MHEVEQTLTDSFGRHHTYLRISLTERCNMRCTYCMPEEGVELRPKQEMLTFEEILRLAGLFAAEGVNKVRLTGGEPLIRKDIEDLVRRLGQIPGIKSMAITTNGLLLASKLEALKHAGVDLFNISLDTLKTDRFFEITRREGLDVVQDAITRTIEAGYECVKVNCVVQRGFNDDELVDFVEMTRNQPVEIRFIEYMPFWGNEWEERLFFPYSEMLDTIRSAYPDLSRLQDGPNDVSKTYFVPDFKGRIGFITSMSEHFCSSCNRLRLTADGCLKVCLFGQAEISLRDAMRNGASDADLLPLIRAAVGRKKASHAGMHAISQSENRPMILIGG